jgi:hypothetical protein
MRLRVSLPSAAGRSRRNDEHGINFNASEFLEVCD